MSSSSKQLSKNLAQYMGRLMKSKKTWYINSDVHWAHVERVMEKELGVHWVRLPTYLPDIPLAMIPLTKEEQAQFDKLKWLGRIQFKTLPHFTKVELKAYLETVYNVEIDSIQTRNYYGQEIDKTTKLPDWKEVSIYLKPPTKLSK